MRFSGNRHGGDLDAALDFSINVSPLGAPRCALRAARRALKHACGKYPDTGCGELRRALSEKEGVPTEKILVGNGAADLIYAFAASIAGKDAVAVGPTFSEYFSAVRAFGGDCKLVFSYAEAERSVRNGGCAAVFVCLPNNPDGYLPTAEEFMRLADACAQCGAVLVADACFIDFTAEKWFYAENLIKFPSVLILQALTKSCALAGLRVGYLMGDENVLKKIAPFTQPWNVSAIAQAAGTAAARDIKYFSKMRRMVEAERGYLREQLQLLGFSPRKSQANFLLFQGEKDLKAFLRERGIAIRDCSDFEGLQPEEGMLYYRIGVKKHSANVRLIKALQKFRSEKGRG